MGSTLLPPELHAIAAKMEDKKSLWDRHRDLDRYIPQIAEAGEQLIVLSGRLADAAIAFQDRVRGELDQYRKDSRP